MSGPYPRILLTAVLGGTVVVSLLAGPLPTWIVATAGYPLWMLIPGLAVYFLLERHPSALEAAAAAVALSPLVVTILAILSMIAGTSVGLTTVLVSVAATALGVAGARGFRRPRWDFSIRQWLALAALAGLVCVLVGYLPLSNEWWRVRSDAWFHRAVVAQIATYGLPPEDPYFAGFGLQYMWFYHVLVLTLSRAMNIDPFVVPTILNLHSVVGLILATTLFAGVLRNRFGHRFASAATVMFAFNGLFWVYLPLKAMRAFLGDVRDTAELSRIFSLSGLDSIRAQQFVTIYYNQDFFLDKFIVATALSLAMVYMALFWYAAVEFLRSRRKSSLLFVIASLWGMLGFHTLFGFVMLAGAFGAMTVMWFLRRRVSGFSATALLTLAAACALAAAAISPYLYSVMHLKESEQIFPIGVAFNKLAAIFISCTSVAVLCFFQRRFFAESQTHSRFAQLCAFSVILFCALIQLPGPNTYDKLPIFVFYPLAVFGGWTIADLAYRKRPVLAAVLVLLFFVPVNAISFAGQFRTTPESVYTVDEGELAKWVRENTNRDAVFIDRDDRVFLLVAGPRRYFWGRKAYADQWGYDKLEMARRLHTRNALYSTKPLDKVALESLGKAHYDLYVVDRTDEHSADQDALHRYPRLFERVYSVGELELYRIRKAACLQAANDPEVETVSQEDLLRESGN